ncbi:ribonuclease HI [Leptolyngbya sp. FACHB-261]|uniref:ribonuclease HI n=1 Tax=Leptolyngbya sp. FACHB-261 TaxID=2692806 RepID=UPI0016852895|nr:ribonuclease HI [Leptolyngbya sp. FACHB-261]MBD2101508.1 ribonuclease HI [Leptolyngbya sp. FACHB-261]
MNNLDCIHLTGVRGYGHIGALPEEQALGQWFQVDASLWLDVSRPGETDALDDALDYRYAVAAIQDTIATARFALLEKLATVLAQKLLAESRVQQVRVKVTKLNTPIPGFAGEIAVEIVRGRDPLPQSLPGTERGAEASPVVTSPVAKGKDTKRQEPDQQDFNPPPSLAGKGAGGDPSAKIVKAMYTDGACSGNPGPGGWGVVVYFQDGSSHELGGAAANTTNNRMEMQAAIAALEFFQAHPQTERITLYTDSEYLRNGITKWISGWKKRGWKTADGKPVKNEDLWRQLDFLYTPSVVNWQYVRGHAGDVGNERADAIAAAFAQQRSPKLTQVIAS